jgi:hypothetical protein
MVIEIDERPASHHLLDDYREGHKRDAGANQLSAARRVRHEMVFSCDSTSSWALAIRSSQEDSSSASSSVDSMHLRLRTAAR